VAGSDDADRPPSTVHRQLQRKTMQTEITPIPTTSQTGFLTEKIIQKVTLGFLKNYYKYRPRMLKAPTVTSIDMRTEDGIIADGFYSFKTPTGKDFLATFEATSYHTKKEVTYKKQRNILSWDGLAIACIVTTFLFSHGFVYNHFTVKELGAWVALAAVGLSVFFFTMMYRLIGASFSRYRYIYAVEQFKKYHADEQWVAIGHDVFESSLDKYLKELKRQCVYNGFGLLSIDKKFDPQVLITPARQELFNGKRKQRQFSKKPNALSRVAPKKLPGVFGKMSERLKNTRKEEEQQMSRFSRTYAHQMLVASICLFLMGGIFVRELADADLIVLDQDEHFQSVNDLSNSDEKPEPSGLIVDSAYQNTTEKLGVEQEWWVVANERSRRKRALVNNEEYRPSEYSIFNSADQIDVLLTLENGDYLAYDCERFMNFKGKKYVVQEGQYFDFQAASSRMQVLASNNLVSNILNLGCFSEKETDYIVFYSQLFNTKRDAARALERFNFAAEAVDLYLEKLEVRELYLQDEN
jgi:hypothetical protein